MRERTRLEREFDDARRERERERMLREGAVIRRLGVANGWKEQPALVTACRAAGHQTAEANLGPCYWRVRCDQCGYVYEYDSSG